MFIKSVIALVADFTSSPSSLSLLTQSKLNFSPLPTVKDAIHRLARSAREIEDFTVLLSLSSTSRTKSETPPGTLVRCPG